MTVGELQEALDKFPVDLPVVIEAAGLGKDDRSQIHDVQLAIYEGEEIHIIAESGVQGS